MQKSYIIVLSSLIACTSRGMDESLFIASWVQEAAKEDVLTLQKQKQLIPHHVSNAINNQFMRYAHDNGISDEIMLEAQKKYRSLYRDITALCLHGNAIARFHVNPNATEIVVIEAADAASDKRAINVWRELPAKWHLGEAWPEDCKEWSVVTIQGDSFKGWAKKRAEWTSSAIWTSDEKTSASNQWMNPSTKVLVFYDVLSGIIMQRSIKMYEDAYMAENPDAERYKHVTVLNEKEVSIECQEKIISGTRSHIKIEYIPTLEAIAQHLVKQAQKAESFIKENDE
jgi:hypothetical protein